MNPRIPYLIKELAVAALVCGVSWFSATGTAFRWAGGSNIIYVENGGTATLSDIQAALPNGPLCLIDPTNRIWFLSATIKVTDGSTLQIHGPSVGGDVNQLLLRSDNSMATGSYAALVADGGTLDLNSVKVTSWDQLSTAPDTEHTVFKRAFIRALPSQVGSVIQQSTLNVVNSEISYLGFNHNDSYGLTWQGVSSVEGYAVFGNVSGSFIHHCQLGVSSWAEDGVSWSGNEIAFNTLYGFASDDSGHQVTLASNNVHDNDYGPVFRWAGSSQRIYVTGPGSATLSDIKAALPNAPLTLVNPPLPGAVVYTSNLVWHLGANLFVENGARLELYGPAIGGDVAELRLKSDNTTNDNAFVELRADWGWLDIRNTKIMSWDSAVNGPDTETTAYRRAYVRARSTLDPDGVTAHESRMDVINSEISYLGSQNSEAYGLTWKVVDTTAQFLAPGSTNTLFDLVNVYGDIINSRIHHNHFGVYAYGHEGGQWRNNEVDHNLRYGFDPHDDSDHLVIENNNVHHNGWHGIIASKRCDSGVLRSNVSWNNGLDLVDPHGHGIMLHRSCNDWVIEGNQSYGNADTGIAIFASDRTVIRNNVCAGNTNAGIRLTVGSADNWIEANEVGGMHRYGLYLFEGSDEPEPDADGGPGSGRCHGNVFTNNLVYDCTSDSIKVTSADDNAFLGNLLVGNNPTLRFENCTNILVADNLLPSGTHVRLAAAVATGPSFAADSGTITAPFTAHNGTISQTVLTGVTNGGEARYDFFVPRTGDYVVSANVFAPDPSQNSLYINIDAQPTDPLMIWDIPVSAGVTNRTVSWRGSGSGDPTTSSYQPKVFALSAGAHQLVIRGREPHTEFGTITIAQSVTTPAGAGLTTVTFENQPRLNVQLDSDNIATFASDSGGVFASDQTDLTTFVTGDGSVATLTSEQVGTGPGQVFIRNFFVDPDSSSARINVTAWNLGDDYRKVWSVRSSSASTQINYRVGDLNPGTAYTVSRGGSLVINTTADPEGYISFGSAPQSTSPVSYTVSPANILLGIVPEISQPSESGAQ